jgi:cyclophilin family peptidyl-prolyl cis-trans isomerase
VYRIRALTKEVYDLRSLFTGVLLFALVGCSQTNSTDTGSAQTDTAATATTASETASQPAAAPAATPEPQEKPMSAYENKVAELHTTAGQINLRFFPDVAPNHVRNFIDLAEKGFYNGTKFHRVIAGFMIQGGDPNTISGSPNTWGTGGSPNHVKAEFNRISHKRGILSMARAQDPNSASSQFFIVVADSTFLDNQYTVFGQVTRGMEVADAIVASASGRERPDQPVTITKVVIRDANDDEKGPTPQ